jgi:hypothetical protein
VKGTFVMRRGRLVRRERAGPPPQAGRILGAGAANVIISDELGAQLEHHGYADGRRTDSKSVFRRWTKDAGLSKRATIGSVPSVQKRKM